MVSEADPLEGIGMQGLLSMGSPNTNSQEMQPVNSIVERP